MDRFRLSDNFIEQYKTKEPKFGFNGLGALVYYRTYSRLKSDGGSEAWWETCRRVVEGTYSMQKRHIDEHGLGWNAWKAQKSAQEMFERMFDMKFLPPGRGLWAMGSPITEERKLFAALQNCAFVSTQNIKDDLAKPFVFLMDFSMLGCVAPDTWIMTYEGPRKIKDLQGHPFVAQVNGKPYFAPIGSYISGVKSVVKISTKDGFDITLTADHKLKLASGEWLEAGKLIQGNKLSLNNHRDTIPQWDGNGTYEQGYLAGIYWGDGYKSRDPLAVVYFRDKGHEGIQAEGLRCALTLEHRADCKGWRSREKREIAELSIGTWLWKYFRLQDKTITEAIEMASSAFVRGFLKGAFDTDGTVLVGKKFTRNVSLSQSNYENLQTIQRMLLRFGIFSKICIKRSKQELRTFPGRTKPCVARKAWTLYITRDSISEFFKFVGFSHTEKSKKLNAILTKRQRPTSFVAIVKEVVPLGEMTVWDITVNDVHAFDANGFYAHNCGVGFDTLGAGQIVVKGPNSKRAIEKYIIPDTREGWVESVRIFIESYFLGTAPVEFDYSQIRKKGSIIKGFGGISAGEKPLIELHANIRSVLEREVGSPISVTAIVDIQNFIGKAVVAGNVRRTAEIVFGDPEDNNYLDLKNYKVNSQRETYGWTSNNSVFAKLGMNYHKVCERIQNNGEPGLLWLENSRGYSRMTNGPDNKDHRVMGTNPCGEQSLESMECCNLVETFPARHDTFEDYLRTLKFAYLYAKTVTLGNTHWPETNRVMLRNRRIGCSASGIQQFLVKHNLNDLRKWFEEGYRTLESWDKIYSDWFAIPRSIKITSIKPSGTVSLLAGATPGMHWPKSRFYIRRIRLSKFSDLVGILEKAGYLVEPCYGSEDSTVVIEVPIDVGEGVRTLKEVSMWEQLSMAAFIQKYWADNQVSCTVTFKPETEGSQIEHALDYFQYQLKGISFLPDHEEGAYRQMPYEEITEKQYNERLLKLKKINFMKSKDIEKDVEKFCDGESCLLAAPIVES